MSTWQTSQFKARILVENCIPLFPTGNNIDKRTSSSMKVPNAKDVEKNSATIAPASSEAPHNFGKPAA
eukprot:CAMPEP_0204075390 /NCGR_PEP_ID=MMETSP0360-20130528/166257_1 /ASSEMBLY_ACC=CAM_ASM_000342 /TAXON_ID=268821 /ORGANISM="Scrippsiella Hangoei, Strain SHTV-5" /LENGTH=67 /DNA_ID=CAMNT_0051023881 /DNA_START=77 /DNA_END=276 /DNA_ORIENTATION=+